MSTICKLDPQVRADRSWRMHTIRRLQKTTTLLQQQGNVKQGLVIGMLLTLLTRVRSLSWLPGEVKQRVFLKHIPLAL